MNYSEQVTELKRKLKQVNDKTVIPLKEEIEELEAKIFHKKDKKLINTYWKYNNGYNTAERWWLYSHCIGLGRLRDTFVYNSFEVTPMGIEIRIKDTRGQCLQQHKITKREFEIALKKTVKLMNNL